MNNPIVTIEMEGGGRIRAELYPDLAPNTVANFVTLIQSGFYHAPTEEVNTGGKQNQRHYSRNWW